MARQVALRSMFASGINYVPHLSARTPDANGGHLHMGAPPLAQQASARSAATGTPGIARRSFVPPPRPRKGSCKLTLVLLTVGVITAVPAGFGLFAERRAAPNGAPSAPGPRREGEGGVAGASPGRQIGETGCGCAARTHACVAADVCGAGWSAKCTASCTSRWLSWFEVAMHVRGSVLRRPCLHRCRRTLTPGVLMSGDDCQASS